VCYGWTERINSACVTTMFGVGNEIGWEWRGNCRSAVVKGEVVIGKKNGT